MSATAKTLPASTNNTNGMMNSFFMISLLLEYDTCISLLGRLFTFFLEADEMKISVELVFEQPSYNIIAASKAAACEGAAVASSPYEIISSSKAASDYCRPWPAWADESEYR